MNAELGFGIIRGFEGPELAGTPAQHLCSRCECAHGLCRRSSKLGFRLVVLSLRRTSVGRKLETKLSGNAELGFAAGGRGQGMGFGAGLGCGPLGVVKQRKTPRQRDRGAGLTAKP